MATKKKQYKNYQEYYDSPEWKALKEEFYDQYDGFTNVCQISGRKIDKDNGDGEYMSLHHWRYPKDWNNDSIENLILVCNDVSNWIYDHELTLEGDLDEETITSREKCRCELIAKYIAVQTIDSECDGYQYGRKSAINESNISNAMEINRVICELIFDKKIKLTSDIHTMLREDGVCEVFQGLCLDGVKLPKINSEFMIGMLKQVCQSRSKYGIEYDVNFRHKGRQ